MALMRACVGLEIVPVVDEEGARRSSRLPCALNAKGRRQKMIPVKTEVYSLSDLLHRSKCFQTFILHPSANRLFNSRERNPDSTLIVHGPIVEECERPVSEEWCGIRHEAELKITVRDG